MNLDETNQEMLPQLHVRGRRTRDFVVDLDTRRTSRKHARSKFLRSRTGSSATVGERPGPQVPEVGDGRWEHGGRLRGLHGLGGVGKTTLAASLAKEMAEDRIFADGIYWLTLGEEPTEAQLLSWLAELMRFFGDYEYQATMISRPRPISARFWRRSGP